METDAIANYVVTTVLFVGLYTGFVYWRTPDRLSVGFVLVSALVFFVVYAGASTVLDSQLEKRK